VFGNPPTVKARLAQPRSEVRTKNGNQLHPLVASSPEVYQSSAPTRSPDISTSSRHYFKDCCNLWQASCQGYRGCPCTLSLPCCSACRMIGHASQQAIMTSQSKTDGIILLRPNIVYADMPTEHASSKYVTSRVRLGL
jgi:hypothetical protein